MDSSDTIAGSLGLESSEAMSALQLNGIKLDSKHTVLTPGKLESMVEKSTGNHKGAAHKKSWQSVSGRFHDLFGRFHN